MLQKPTHGFFESQKNYRRALEYAETLAGGLEALASRLRVSSSKLKVWADGLEDIPDSIYLAIVDIICEASDEALRRTHWRQGSSQSEEHESRK
jgi:hypothetical protein